MIEEQTASELYQNPPEVLHPYSFLHRTTHVDVAVGISFVDAEGANLEFRAKSRFQVNIIAEVDGVWQYADANSYINDPLVVRELHLVLRAITKFNRGDMSYYEFKTYLMCENATREAFNGPL